MRTFVAMRRLWDWFVSAFHRPTIPTLTNHLPRVPGRIYPDVTSSPISSRAVEERVEAMLLDIMRAPPKYAEAVMVVARASIALRARGDNVYSEGLVVFTLSRMVSDHDGTIPFQRLRARLGELPTRSSIIATLLRLEEQGVVKFDSDAQNDAASASRFMRLDDVRIRLMVEP
jgi:hypothetical protein